MLETKPEFQPGTGALVWITRKQPARPAYKLLNCLHRKHSPDHTRRGARHLVVDPPVGFFEPVTQTNGRLPAEVTFDQRIVAVAPVDSFWGFQVVVSFELESGNVLDDVHQPIDRNYFAAAEIDRFDDLATQDGLTAVYAIIDIHEAPGLFAVAPDFDLMFA